MWDRPINKMWSNCSPCNRWGRYAWSWRMSMRVSWPPASSMWIATGLGSWIPAHSCTGGYLCPLPLEQVWGHTAGQNADQQCFWGILTCFWRVRALQGNWLECHGQIPSRGCHYQDPSHQAGIGKQDKNGSRILKRAAQEDQLKSLVNNFSLDVHVNQFDVR